MDTYLALKKRYAFLQQDFSRTLNLVKSTIKEDNDYKPSKQMLDNGVVKPLSFNCIK